MKIDQETLAEICDRHGITRVRLFGSFGRGDSDDKSDIDLLVDFDSRKSLMDLVRIEREFADRFGRDVDLLREPSLSPYLRERILSEARVVYERTSR
jgi:uncharacterized protein